MIMMMTDVEQRVIGKEQTKRDIVDRETMAKTEE